MQTSRSTSLTSRVPAPIILVLAGGVLAGVGSLLPWLKVSAGAASNTVSGISGWNGRVAGLAGLYMIIRGAMAFGSRVPKRSRAMLVAAGVSAIVAVGISVYDLLTYKSQTVNDAVQYMVQRGTPAAQARTEIEGALNSGQIHLSPQIGLVMALVGGLLGLAGVVMVLARSRAAVPDASAWIAAGAAPAFPPPLPPAVPPVAAGPAPAGAPAFSAAPPPPMPTTEAPPAGDPPPPGGLGGQGAPEAPPSL